MNFVLFHGNLLACSFAIPFVTARIKKKKVGERVLGHFLIERIEI